MASIMWGRRIVHFANMPLKLVMPKRTDGIKMLVFKTIPSVSKVEIERVLKNLYGFNITSVNTANIAGKKKKRGGIVLAKPDYKKAYVKLKYPLSLPPNAFPATALERHTKELAERGIPCQGTKKKKFVDPDADGTHWLQSHSDRVASDRARCMKKKYDRVERNAPKYSPHPWQSPLSWK